MSGLQKNRDGLDSEETVSENVKKLHKIKLKFTKTKTIKGKRDACNIVWVWGVGT